VDCRRGPRCPPFPLRDAASAIAAGRCGDARSRRSAGEHRRGGRNARARPLRGVLAAGGADPAHRARAGRCGAGRRHRTGHTAASPTDLARRPFDRRGGGPRQGCRGHAGERQGRARPCQCRSAFCRCGSVAGRQAPGRSHRFERSARPSHADRRYPARCLALGGLCRAHGAAPARGGARRSAARDCRPVGTDRAAFTDQRGGAATPT